MSKPLATDFFKQSRHAREVEKAMERRLFEGIGAIRQKFGSRVTVFRIHDSVNVEFNGNPAPSVEEIAEVEVILRFGKTPFSPLTSSP